jgi:hypothetical protein
MQNIIAIGPLTKVRLNLTARADDSSGGPLQANAQLEFIYGIGTDGLSAFEKKLHGLLAGARMTIRAEADGMQFYFEHLRCPLIEALQLHPPFDLAIEVLSVTNATNRELVHALANRDGSGCDCNCGCDCGC